MSESKDTHITVTEGMRGYFAVMVHWVEVGDGGFWEPLLSADWSFETREEAIADAKVWGEAEDMPVRC